MKLDDAARLARTLMDYHCLGTWVFRFDRAIRRFGCCNWTTRTISLSAVLTRSNTDEQIRDTILHEIAHALAGPRAGHGKLWKCSG